MARLNSEYGSELHLLRMLGRHRSYFDRKVCGATGADHIEWRDFPSGESRRDKDGHVLWDREWHHFQFLPAGDGARMAWDGAWPTHRTGHNWDASVSFVMARERNGCWSRPKRISRSSFLFAARETPIASSSFKKR